MKFIEWILDIFGIKINIFFSSKLDPKGTKNDQIAKYVQSGDEIRCQVKKDDDLKVENGDVTVVIDPLSLQYLDSAEIDYSADNFSSQFVIRNPNVQATCGCGSSFAV